MTYAIADRILSDPDDYYNLLDVWPGDGRDDIHRSYTASK